MNFHHQGRFYRKEADICDWLRRFNISNYVVNSDLTVDVRSTIDLCNMGLTFLPIQFGVVDGSFFVHYNSLCNLIGAPREISGHFFCNHNCLSSLKGGPREVGSAYDCSHNQLTSLSGAPKEIYKAFSCNSNNLSSFEGAPKFIGGDFVCNTNKIVDLKGCPRIVDKSFYILDNLYPVLSNDIEKVCKIGDELRIHIAV